jgi:hypothetical protein
MRYFAVKANLESRRLPFRPHYCAPTTPFQPDCVGGCLFKPRAIVEVNGLRGQPQYLTWQQHLTHAIRSDTLPEVTSTIPRLGRGMGVAFRHEGIIMHAPPTLQQLSDDIVSLANQITGMPQRLRNREITEFVRATLPQREVIAHTLQLTPAQVMGLVVDAQAVGTISSADGRAAAPKRTQPELWDYDVAAATLEDLTRRRELLRNRLRILEYLRYH